YSRDERPIEPVNATLPEIQLSSFSPIQVFGKNDFLPNNTKENKVQIKDSLHYVVGTHKFKVGTDLLFMHIDNLFPRYLSGAFFSNSVQGFVDGTPTSFQQGYGPGGGLTSWTQNTYAFYGTDNVRVTPQLTLDVGIRYDWQTTPKPAANAFPQHPEFITQIKE